MVALGKFIRESFLEGVTFEHLNGKQLAQPTSSGRALQAEGRANTKAQQEASLT